MSEDNFAVSEADRRIRENSRVLKEIAKAFPPKSLQREALKISAFAFGYVILHHEEEFDKYVENIYKPLTKAERARFKAERARLKKYFNGQRRDGRSDS